MMYRITVKSISSDSKLLFHRVENYEVIDGFLTFVDTKTGNTKRFAVANCEIEEM